MELIPINESKLKIMLDESDMREYNIGDEADCANSETRLAIRHILDRAKDQIGFNTEGSEIFVQLYTSKKGGCELFVTKSTVTSNSIVASTAQPDKRNKKRADASAHAHSNPSATRATQATKIKRQEYGKLFYSFESLGDLCRVCRLLDSPDNTLHSSAYKDENGLYYLSLSGNDASEFTRLDKLTFILEFGEREKGYNLSTYLGEHASVICDGNAIATLAEF